MKNLMSLDLLKRKKGKKKRRRRKKKTLLLELKFILLLDKT